MHCYHYLCAQQLVHQWHCCSPCQPVTSFIRPASTFLKASLLNRFFLYRQGHVAFLVECTRNGYLRREKRLSRAYREAGGWKPCESLKSLMLKRFPFSFFWLFKEVNIICCRGGRRKKMCMNSPLRNRFWRVASLSCFALFAY